MKNIEVFNFTVLEIFHCCLKSFPVPADMTIETIAKEVAEFFEKPESTKEFEIHLNSIKDTVMHSAFWLRDEGYIVFKRQAIGGYFTATLSQKGLVALNATPAVLESNKTYKEIFYKGLANLPFNVAATAIGEFFKNGS